jgi:lactate 2-monooxygenase
MYGVALAGQRGVEEVISNVLAEFDLTMSLTGVRNIGEINRNLLVPNPPV